MNTTITTNLAAVQLLDQLDAIQAQPLRAAIERARGDMKHAQRIADRAVALLDTGLSAMNAICAAALQLAASDDDDKTDDAKDTAPKPADDDPLRAILEKAKAGEAEAIEKLKREQNEKLK